jgi:hypothetical protein
MVHHFLRTIGWWIRNIALVNFDPYPSRNPAPTPADFQQLVPSEVENPGDVYPESSPKFVHLRLSPPPFLFIGTINQVSNHWQPTIFRIDGEIIRNSPSFRLRQDSVWKTALTNPLKAIDTGFLCLSSFPIDTGPIKVIYHWQVLFTT